MVHSHANKISYPTTWTLATCSQVFLLLSGRKFVVAFKDFMERVETSATKDYFDWHSDTDFQHDAYNAWHSDEVKEQAAFLQIELV